MNPPPSSEVVAQVRGWYTDNDSSTVSAQTVNYNNTHNKHNGTQKTNNDNDDDDENNNTPFTRSIKHQATIKQQSSKCIENTRAQRVL